MEQCEDPVHFIDTFISLFANFANASQGQYTQDKSTSRIPILTRLIRHKCKQNKTNFVTQTFPE